MAKEPRKHLYREIERLTRELALLRNGLPPEELEPLDELDEWERSVTDALAHLHHDLVAIRAHLGLHHPGCAPAEEHTGT